MKCQFLKYIIKTRFRTKLVVDKCSTSDARVKKQNYFSKQSDKKAGKLSSDWLISFLSKDRAIKYFIGDRHRETGKLDHKSIGKYGEKLLWSFFDVSSCVYHSRCSIPIDAPPAVNAPLRYITYPLNGQTNGRFYISGRWLRPYRSM